MIKVIPAILPDSYKGLELNVQKGRDAAKTIQIDFVDGDFAPNRRWIFNKKDQERQ